MRIKEMLNKITRFKKKQKQVLLNLAMKYIAEYNKSDVEFIFASTNRTIEGYDVIIVSDFKCKEGFLLYGFTCSDCDNLLVEFPDYSGPKMDADICRFCGSHYDYSDQELIESGFDDILELIKCKRVLMLK